MTQRRRGRPRCWGCGLNEQLCACSTLPTVELRTPLVIVQHLREQHKPTNTARLLQRMVPTLQMVHFPRIDRVFDTTPFEDPNVTYFTLYPREDAIPLAEAKVPAGHRIGFVVLDGTWHQCSRMSRRVPRVCDLPCVALTLGPRSIWRVRTQHDERGLSTFEAVVRLIEQCEGPEAAEPLATAFERITARLLFMKGKLRSPEVPTDWNAAFDPPDPED